MQLNQIKPKTKNKKPKYVGRGGRHGKTSGRGTKGQNARAGRKKRPEMRDIIKKLPKRRGYRFQSIQTKPVVIPVFSLSVFENGDKVTIEALINKKLVSKSKGMHPKVKILSGGELAKKLTISGCTVSASARAIIEKAGGSVVEN